jgi:hypothetical protein
VLLKVADVAIAEGVLDPSYYEYQNYPALMTAKIEYYQRGSERFDSKSVPGQRHQRTQPNDIFMPKGIYNLVPAFAAQMVYLSIIISLFRYFG